MRVQSATQPIRRYDSPEGIGALAVHALLLEVDTWPKPGLVSNVDNGSHRDMTAATLRRSAFALQPYFVELTAAGAGAAAMPQLRAIGLSAEAVMLKATGGINTHRGAIFGLGLLCAAAGALMHRSIPRAALGDAVRRRWGADILAAPVPVNSHGSQVLRRYGSGGARQEAAGGFPHVYHIGLPALHAGRAAPQSNEEAARVHLCFALIARLEDTNLLHRGGADGLAFARAVARGFVDQGGIAASHWKQRAAFIHRAFVARGLSPGGSADLTAMTLFVDAIEQPDGVVIRGQPDTGGMPNRK